VRVTDLRTPAVLVDSGRVERNIERLQVAADARRIHLRPHAKTHKSPLLAQQQIDRGAVGICCAKLGEAEVFADAGITDIRLPYPINPANGARVLALLDRVHLSFIVDDLDVARGWSAVMRDAHRDVDVLVKVDVGFHRCGIDPLADNAAERVVQIAELPGLRFRGLLSHAGQAYGAASDTDLGRIAEHERQLMTDLAGEIRSSGVTVNEISVGATPTARFSLHLKGITEMRPGNYIYYDRTQVGLGAATWDDCALTVLARVVSTPAADRVILDCGSKTLTNDLGRGFGGAPGHGTVFEDLESRRPDESLVIERLSEEHANVRIVPVSGDRGSASARRLVTGDLVRVLPNHSCVVSNLVDAVWLERDGEVLGELPVAARGRIT
jgi:D-serine deaminase-like pyridoxal phosphate-dependent protein